MKKASEDFKKNTALIKNLTKQFHHLQQEQKKLVISVNLNDTQGKIRFVQTHWIDLRAAVVSDSEERDSTTTG